MTVRITRILQYSFPDAETAIEDMTGWQVPPNGTKRHGKKLVSSATLPIELLRPEDQDFDGETRDYIPQHDPEGQL